MQTTQSKIVLVHRGGLGDFLTAWPAMFSLAAHFAGQDVSWLGSPSRLPWLERFGVRSCPGNVRRGVDALFVRNKAWPEELRDAKLFWFVLKALPPITLHPGLFLLQGLRGDLPGPVRDSYLRQLLDVGIAHDDQWLRSWRRAFPRQTRDADAPKTALLFPGAGHPAKQWPLVQFFELAEWLCREGFMPCFVLGPAEVERGLDMGNFPAKRPASLEVLSELLRTADLAVGNDSGPMHLAGMLGTPGVVLFGPAAPSRWAPFGLRIVSAKTPCAPCTEDGRIACAHARCMHDLAQGEVRKAVLSLARNGV